MGLEDFVRDGRSPLLQMLGAAPVAHRVFQIAEGRLAGKPLAVRWISAEARAGACADAIKHLVKTCGWEREDLFTPLGAGVLDQETKVRMLAAGLASPDDVTRPLAKDADEIRRLLSSGEIDALHQELCAFIEEQEPFDKIKAWEEVESFVQALGKGSTLPRSWSSYGTAMLRFMLRETAFRLYGRPTCSSSDTTPASGSGPGSSPAEG